MGDIHELVIQHGRDRARQLVEADEKRYVDLAAEMLGDESTSISYMYSGFAMTTLPHRPLADTAIWERRNGKLTLLVEPGYLYEGETSVRYGVPYGSRARLIMFYLQTEALRTRSRVIRLGNSMTDWMGRMGINPGGTNFKAVRNQTKRLSACRLTVGWTSDDGSNGFTRENIVSAMINPPQNGDPRQGRLWEETAELSEGFYNALIEHPVPCEERAIKLIQNSSTVIDLYIWLCYRLHALPKPTIVPWPKLAEQFGGSYSRLYHFKPRFTESLKEALAVYPDAKVEVVSGGVKLMPSPPAVPQARIHQVLLPGESNSAKRDTSVKQLALRA